MKHHKNLPYLKHVLDAITDIEGSVKKLSKEEFKRSKDIKEKNLLDQINRIHNSIIVIIINYKPCRIP